MLDDLLAQLKLKVQKLKSSSHCRMIPELRSISSDKTEIRTVTEYTVCVGKQKHFVKHS